MTYAPGLSAIRFSDAPGLLAQTDADTGVCLISSGLWAGLTAQQRYFLLLHEAAHLEAATTDELASDARALAVYRRRFPTYLWPTYTLLTHVLNQHDSVHAHRLATHLANIL